MLIHRGQRECDPDEGLLRPGGSTHDTYRMDGSESAVATLAGPEGESQKRSFARQAWRTTVPQDRSAKHAMSAPTSRPRGFAIRPGHRLWARVNPRQHPEAQRDALTAAGCDEIFLDKASGKPPAWPELDKALLPSNQASGQLVVTKVDRFGRSLARAEVRRARLPIRHPTDSVVLQP